MWVPPAASVTKKAMAIDITIVDPTTKTSLGLLSDSTNLTASKAHEKKMQLHAQQVAASDTELDFDKVPLAFETTGAMGKETQKWWDSVVKLERKNRAQGEPTSRMLLGLEHTWSANNFQTYWLQRISMAHAMEQAEAIDQWITRCTSVSD